MVTEANVRGERSDSRRPNWDVWLHVPVAILWEAVALSLGIDPKRVRMSDHGWAAGPDHFLTDEGPDFDNRLLVASRNLRQEGPLHLQVPLVGGPATCGVELGEFAAWALKIGWHMPQQMCELGIAYRSNAVGEPASARWPWGDYETPLLKALAAAADRWWKRYDPTDATTAPTNDAVVEWLRKEFPDPPMSANIASAIATILRAPSVPTIRR